LQTILRLIRLYLLLRKDFTGMEIISDDDLRDLLRNAPMGVCLLNAATLLIEMANPHFLELTGKRGEDLSGTSYRELFPKTSPADKGREGRNRSGQHGLLPGKKQGRQGYPDRGMAIGKYRGGPQRGTGGHQ